MKCAHCPVSGEQTCLGDTDERFTHFCAEAASGDTVKRRHIVGRSTIQETGSAPIDMALPMRLALLAWYWDSILMFRAEFGYAEPPRRGCGGCGGSAGGEWPDAT